MTEPRIDPNHTQYKLRLGRSKIHRWGVYAAEPIPKNKKIIEYTGERISRKETRRRSDTAEFNYLFTVDKYWTIDGSVGGSGAEFINHSCEPNCRMIKWTVAGKPRMALFAGDKGIMTGEELTYDYNFE